MFLDFDTRFLKQEYIGTVRIQFFPTSWENLVVIQLGITLFYKCLQCGLNALRISSYKNTQPFSKTNPILFSVLRTYVDVTVNYVKPVSDRLKW